MTLLNILKNTDIFHDVPQSQLELIASIVQERKCGLGEVIFEENSASTELYLIAQGEVEIQLNPALVGPENLKGSGPYTIATLRRGQSFGEVALVDQGLRSASARSAANPTLLWVIPRDKLILLCDGNPTLGYRLMRNLATDLAYKIRNASLHIRETLLYGSRYLTKA